jgi:hypothetical protein
MTPLVTFTAADLLDLTDQDLDQLEALAGDEERKALWWQLWRLEREEKELRACARVEKIPMGLTLDDLSNCPPAPTQVPQHGGPRRFWTGRHR